MQKATILKKSKYKYFIKNILHLSVKLTAATVFPPGLYLSIINQSIVSQ